MKQLLKVLALVLVLVLAIGAMVACNDDKGGDKTDGGTTNDGGNNDGGNNDGGNNDGGNNDGGNNDGGNNGGGSQTVDKNAKFTMYGKYIDKSGNPLADYDGTTEAKFRNIKYGNNANDTKTGDVTLFEDYVIIGWNANKEEAMALLGDLRLLREEEI